MKINPISNLSFKRVAAVAGTKENINSLQNALNDARFKRNEDYMFERATDLYEGKNDDGFCSQAVNTEGREVYFLITGKDVNKRKYDWRSREKTGNRINMYTDLSYWSIDNLVKIVRADKRNRDN